MRSRFGRDAGSSTGASDRTQRLIISGAMIGCGLGIVAGMYAASALTHTDNGTPAGLVITVVCAALGSMAGYIAATKLFKKAN